MEVLLFGIAREITGKQKLNIPDEHQIETVAGLKNWLSEQYPAMSQLKSIAVAVDSEYADDEQALNKESEIALIPPVSGG
jgi:molybdopterin synthase sulfur carrier subunit